MSNRTRTAARVGSPSRQKGRRPAVVGPRLAAEFGAGERYYRKNWASVKGEELDKGHTVSQRSARRFGQSSN